MGVEDHGEFRINLESSNYDKIAMDINMIINISKATLEELNTHGTFKLMDKCTLSLKQMQSDDRELLQNVEKNEVLIEELRNQCEEERLINIKTIEETNTKIQKLRFDVEDVLSRLLVIYLIFDL